jgi:hypothetical protein
MDQNDLVSIEARYVNCVHIVTLAECPFLDADWMRDYIKGGGAVAGADISLCLTMSGTPLCLR